MSFSITDRGDLLSDELRQHLERRFLFALSRYDSRVIQTQVVIGQDEVGGGKAANRCQVDVELQRASRVSVSEGNTDLRECISRAAERTGRAVGRSIDNAAPVDGNRSPALHSSIIN
jgi:hypothetical protein